MSTHLRKTTKKYETTNVNSSVPCGSSTGTAMFSATTCISAPNLPDLVPTQTLNEHDYLSSGPQPSTEEMLEAAQMRIVQLEAALQQKAPFRWLQMKPDSTVKFYTGFPSLEILVKTFNALQPTAENSTPGLRCNC